MPTPTEGQITLVADIAGEFTDLGTSNVSLFAARDEAGLDAGQVAMTQFYNLSDAVASTVSTDSTANVSTSQIRVYGNVTNDGGATITDRGFYFGTSSNYASNTKYSVGGTTGSFNRLFTGLNSNTTYYYTAYAINSVGESRGTTKSQATSFNYTFKSGTVYKLNDTGTNLYYYNVSGGWNYRSAINADPWNCESFCTNRTNRYYDTVNASKAFWTMKSGNQTQAGCPGNTMAFGSFSIVNGTDFSNSSSYWQIRGVSAGLDIRFTAS